MTIGFDLYMIGSQDGYGASFGGPDGWGLTANGSTLISTNFANYTGGGNLQAFNGQANPNNPGVAPRTGSDTSLAGQLGFGTGDFGDATYHLLFTFANTNPTLVFNFTSGENEGNGNEGWGLDNVVVTNRVTAVPEPGSVALLAGMGLSGVGFLARRRHRQTA